MYKLLISIAFLLYASWGIRHFFIYINKLKVLDKNKSEDLVKYRTLQGRYIGLGIVAIAVLAVFFVMLVLIKKWDKFF